MKSFPLQYEDFMKLTNNTLKCPNAVVKIRCILSEHPTCQTLPVFWTVARKRRKGAEKCRDTIRDEYI